ncbi:MAG TPA: ATP-binding protein [Caulobacteraceae bacterium]|nr:ATP-binding protein [Caulobacteraceae bacterium]
MFATIECLKQHDLSLVLWAAVVCVISVAAAFGAYRRAVLTRGGLRLAWIAAAATLMGTGIWATHFLSMLAYRKDMDLGFDLGLTGLSWLTSVTGMGIGVAVCAQSRDFKGRLAGGAICGAVAALLHFMGMAAIRLPALLVWDQGLVAAAISFGVAGSAATFAVAGKLDRRTRWFGAATLLCLAILCLHYTGMAAVTLIPDAQAIDTGPIGRVALAWGVVGLVGLIVLGGLGVVGIDRISTHYALSSMRTALSCTPSPLAIFNANSRLAFWNDGYAQALSLIDLTAERGLSYRTIIAAAVKHGLPPSLSDTHRTILAASDRALDPFMAPDGRWLQPKLGQTQDGGFVVLLSDVSAQTEARKAAEAAARAKDEFLANMSHEIRTPLNAVLGMAHVMRCHPLEPDQAKRLGLIEDAARVLNGLLNHVMDLSKIEAGTMKVQREAFDLAATVESAAADHALEASKKSLGFTVEIDPAATGYWRGDSGKLYKVIDTLLSNAVKFTERGRVTVRAHCIPEGLRIAVQDTGIGVGGDMRTLIFQAFAQADGSATRRFGGVGLGLTMAQRLVELMGGELKVESVENAGSTFTFDLPLERDVAPQADEAAQAAGPGDGRDPSLVILAAEDNPTNQLVLNAILEPLGVDLTMTANGSEAVEAFGARRFDLILMDIQMPGMNGVEATSEIRRREKETGQARTPIVAVTANVMQEQVDSYLAAGMDGVVAKPIDMTALLQAMDAALCSNEPVKPAAKAAEA